MVVSMPKLLATLLLITLSQAGCNVESASEGAAAAPEDKSTTLITQAKAVHASALTIDAHADIEIPGKPSMYVGAYGLSRVSPAKMHAGGLDAVVM